MSLLYLSMTWFFKTLFWFTFINNLLKLYFRICQNISYNAIFSLILSLERLISKCQGLPFVLRAAILIMYTKKNLHWNKKNPVNWRLPSFYPLIFVYFKSFLYLNYGDFNIFNPKRKLMSLNILILNIFFLTEPLVKKTGLTNNKKKNH